jgi:hypothetical protein
MRHAQLPRVVAGCVVATGAGGAIIVVGNVIASCVVGSVVGGAR